MLSDIRIVLVHTSHPGNIGAAARAMKNMCLDQLVLVQPAQFPSAEATARASGADDLLARARCCATLDEALADCALVIGASARLRNVRWPELDPRAAAEQALQASDLAPVALVFGREQSGLSNDELERCHALVHIPSNPEYASLNLAQAVQVLAYEVHMAHLTRSVGGWQAPPPEFPPCTAEQMERFYAHLEQAVIDLEFLDPARPGQLLRRLRRLFQRARLDTNEMNILRGILGAAQDKVRALRTRL
ncbi:MAG TPA: tRNA (cytosine(32)/uridine(32)-2'-O)-methyltransferase TrmJ [Gammaproteobacteria bacterium]